MRKFKPEMKVIFLKCKKKVKKDALIRYKNLQIINARFIYGEEHVRRAIKEAEKAFKNRQNIANNFFVEIILRASAQRSISRAFKLFGVDNTKEVVLIGSKDEIEKFIKEYRAREFRIKIGGKKMRDLIKAFGIGKEEFNLDLSKEEIIKRIINEKIALMNVL